MLLHSLARSLAPTQPPDYSPNMSGAAGADDDTTIVKLMSSDGHIVEMIKKHAKMSITLGNLLDGT